MGRVVVILVYAAGVAVASWRAGRGGWAIPFSAILGGFFVFRLAGECALLALPKDGRPGGPGVERVVGWLVVGRPLATGVFFMALSVAGLVRYPHGLGIVLGAIGLLVGQAGVIVGLDLLRKWRREERADAAQA
jgi:hypothetical protein